MRAVNFTWIDSIRLRVDGREYDLHNDFNFRRFTYDPARQSLLLEWLPRTAGKFAAGEVRGLRISMTGVTGFSCTARDPALPFSEDECLASFGYDSDEDWVNGQFWTDDEPEAEWRWSFIFQSGTEIRVSGEAAAVELDHE